MYTNIEERSKIRCPLCRGKTLILNNVKRNESDIGNFTHIWHCPDCPFVGFEYYEKQNVEDLATFLNNH